MVQVNPLMVMDDKVVAYPVYLARGNTLTCAAQGFIATLSLLTSVSYYTTLMILCELINRVTCNNFPVLMKSNLILTASFIK
jgi:hypothetical protein